MSLGRPRRLEVLACVTAARQRGLDLLVEPSRRHLWLPPHAGGAVPAEVRAHRSIPIAPASSGIESTPDMLEHVAHCLPRLEALVIWESALHHGGISRHEMRTIRWPSPCSRSLAAAASTQSESLLETLTLHRLRGMGLDVRQQVPLRGHRVDFLVNGRLVVQVDGFQFHTAGQRRADIEHDALLGVDGFPALRFAYGDIVERWEHVAGLVLRTLGRIAA